jgi:hypothetical protein
VRWQIRFALGALFGISCGLRNETKGFTGSMFGLNLIMFGTSIIMMRSAGGSDIVLDFSTRFYQRRHRPSSSFSGPIVWYTCWLDADVKSYKSLQFAGVPNAFALMLLIWIAIFTNSHEEAEKSLGRAISDAIMMASMPEMSQDSEPPRILDEF